MLYAEGRDGGTVVRDTRGGADVSHALGDAARQILEALKRRKSISELAPAPGRAKGDELRGEVESLAAKGLLFEE